MTEVLEFAAQWWGLIGVVLIIALKFIFDRKNMVEKTVELIYLAEEKAKQCVLNTGEEKFQWVVENGYQYLPATVKLFISKALYAVIVQEIFDRIKEWAKEKDLIPK